MRENKPLTNETAFYVDDETDIINYGKAEDTYQASMEWKGWNEDSIRSAVMGLRDEVFYNYDEDFKECVWVFDAIARWFPAVFE